MNCCSKSGIQKCAPNSHIHVQIIHRVIMFSSVDPPDDREDCFRMMNCGWIHEKIVWPFYSNSFWTSRVVWFTGCIGVPQFFFFSATGLPVTSSSWRLQVSDSERSTSPDSSFVATGFSVAVSINPPRYAFCSRTWEVDAASDFEFLLVLLAGFPAAMSFQGSEDVIGFFADEELAGTDEDRFITVDFDFATILEFLAQQAELKWLMLKDCRRLFHSSRVKLPLVKMSSSWCLISMYRVWVLESRLILSNNESKATLWVLDTWDFGLLLSF